MSGRSTTPPAAGAAARPPRRSIFGLMGLVFAAGLGFAAIRKPTFHAASLTFTVAVLTLLYSILECLLGRRRDFWAGFVVFGGGYALVAFAAGGWTQVRPYLITSHLLGDLADLIGLSVPSYNGGTLSVSVDFPDGTGLNRWFHSINGDRFQRIGHSMISILAGIAGGLLGTRIARRGRDFAPTGPSNRGEERTWA